MRKILRIFICDFKSNKVFQNISDEILNRKFVKDFDKESQRRRKIYFEEIKQNRKFTKVPHKEKRFNVKLEQATFETKNKEALNKINEEEDSEKRFELLQRINAISLIEDKDKRLNEIIAFVDEINDDEELE